MMITIVKGESKKFTVDVDGDDIFKSSIQINIETASINTNNEQRDEHLKSADFFDAAANKEITFKSSSFTKKSGDDYELKGMLTIKGVPKDIKLDVGFGGVNKDPWGNEKAGFSITGKINCKEWGLNWNAALETGGVLVSEDVKISGELQFVKQA